MALTLRTNGSSGVNLVTASWWNDYYNLMTGAMNDQPVTLNYRPGSNTGNSSLKLKGDGFTPLLLGYDTNSSTITATLDHSGNLTLSGAFSTDGAKIFSDGAGNVEVGVLAFTTLATDASAQGGGHIYNSSGNNALTLKSLQSGATNQGIEFRTWHSSASVVPFSIGGQFGAALSFVDFNGDMHVGGWYYGTSGVLTIGDKLSLDGGNITSNGSGTLTAVQFNGALSGTATNASNVGTIRNGSTTNVPIYTGTNNPSSPPTGSIWIKA